MLLFGFDEAQASAFWREGWGRGEGRPDESSLPCPLSSLYHAESCSHKQLWEIKSSVSGPRGHRHIFIWLCQAIQKAKTHLMSPTTKHHHDSPTHITRPHIHSHSKPTPSCSIG